MSDYIQSHIDSLSEKIINDYASDRAINQISEFDQPDSKLVVEILEKLFMVVYPGFYRDKTYRFYNPEAKVRVVLEDIMFNLVRQITISLLQHPDYADAGYDIREQAAEEIAVSFFETIPKVRALVETDVMAAFDGDPAAYSYSEIILCYPGLYAITTNRLAHELFLLKVPLIPRMMTEYAHSKTGIDIHPGATIGEYFCIDHGTGIVVGETTVIGNNVKVYQGVTLGALSTRGGQSLKGKRRHPTIEDGVTIYAGASILGGDTIIGHDAVIGSNVFITSSVAPKSSVSIKSQELTVKMRKDHSHEIESNERALTDNWIDRNM